MRILDFAKELGLGTKEVLALLHEVGVDARSHFASLTDDQLELARVAALEKGIVVPTEPPPDTAAEETAETADEAAPESEPEAEPEPPKKIVVEGPIVVRDFALALGVKPNLLIAELMGMNVFASINQRIDLRVAQALAHKHGFAFEHQKKQPEPKPQPKPQPKPEPPPPPERVDEILNRPPIVTFMGHVDHGKTSLLDRIREANVVSTESGGITQHIGAYTVNYQDHPITFLDTPGHQAFTAMRARGANLTDIAVIVVAADDGIMPQTKEAIQHAQAAGVCLMVAINKVDLRTANVDRVKRQLQTEGLAPEDWGGDLVCCPVSAATGEGLDHLLEMILLQAEILELKASPKRKAKGYVIESQMEAGQGPTANVLVTEGTLQVGDPVVVQHCWGRIKALINDRGIKVRTAGPSIPVKLLGLTDVPEPGSLFEVLGSDREARKIAEERAAEKRHNALSKAPARKRFTLDDLLASGGGEGAQEKRELPLIIKADVQGSMEAIQQSVLGIKSDKVSLKIVLAGVGNVSANDILLARASSALIMGFHVGIEDGVTKLAKREGVEIKLYSIIYELVEAVESMMLDLLQPIVKEHILGHAEVRQVFEIGKKGRVAGCMVMDGRIRARARARVIRGRDTVFEGSLGSLRRFQNDAAEVRESQECGLRLDGFDQIAVGDTIEVYEIEKVAQQL